MAIIALKIQIPGYWPGICGYISILPPSAAEFYFETDVGLCEKVYAACGGRIFF